MTNSVQQRNSANWEAEIKMLDMVSHGLPLSSMKQKMSDYTGHLLTKRETNSNVCVNYQGRLIIFI